jgi:hypothetical protein
MPAIVVNTIGTGGDYTTLQAWEDACPANLVSADQIWRGEVLNQELAQTLTIAGQTTDATRYVELTAQAGASFADHADKETNPLRYNASVGAAISASAPYGTAVTITTPHTRVSRLQFADGTVGPTRAINITSTSSLLDQCIIRTAVTCGLAGSSGTVRNVFLQSNGGNVFAVGTNTSVLNCTFVRPSNLGNTTWGITNNYTSITIRNTAIFGVSNFTSISFTGNNNASNATIGWGTSNQASLAYADQFEEPSSASGTQDYRLKAGATLIDNGADLSASGVTADIVGTARGATYDIGAWEVATASGTTYDDDLADSLALTESLLATAVFSPTLVDSFATGESLAATASFNAAYTDAVAGADSLTVTTTFGVALPDSVALGESNAAAATLLAVLSDSVAFDEDFVGGLLFSLTTSDEITTADSLIYTLAFGVTLSDSVVMAESFGVSASISTTISDSWGLDESSIGGLVFSMEFSDGFVVGESFADSYTLFSQAAFTMLHVTTMVGRIEIVSDGPSASFNNVTEQQSRV